MDLDALKQDIVFRTSRLGHPFTFHSTWGLFSPRAVDEGSAVLLKHVQVGPEDLSLDLGCGYGVLGVVLARLCPAGRVHLIDKDYVAVELARKNVAVNGLGNCEVYLSNGFSQVPDVRFDTIVSNLPAKVGKELLTILLHDARDHLKGGGQLCVVTVNGLRKFIRRNFEEVFGNYEKLKQGAHYTVARAVRDS